jgi:putative DNA primase/helicase
MHLHDLRDRTEALIKGGSVLDGEEQVQKALGNLSFIARQHQDLGAKFYDLTDDETQEELIQRVQRERIELLILDNFTTLSEGLEDENDAAGFKAVQDFFLQMKKIGVATILVHHSNKSGKQMRGSTALETTFEVILGLERPKVAGPGKAKFVINFGKFRGHGDARLAPRTWALEEGGWQVSDELPDDPREDPVFVALHSLQFSTRAAVGRELGLDKSTVTRRIKRLETLGFLKPGETDELLAKASELKEDEGRLPFHYDPEEEAELAKLELEQF